MKPQKPQKPLKPATSAAFRLRDKLEALARYGVNGEKSAAQVKLDGLIAKFDWSKDPRKIVQKDIFAGKFIPCSYASPVLAFTGNDYDIANTVKFGIESRTGISCVWRASGELWAQVDPSGAKRLTDIAKTVSDAFRALWDQFRKAPGIEPADRSNFIVGLEDGMLGTVRPAQQFPPTRRKPIHVRAKKSDLMRAGIAVHPYQVATKLGEAIRFSVPIEEITNQLAEAIEPKQLTNQ